MPTFLWNDIVFGPIRSRRVGNSLGINLLPTGCKVCTFDCIYCECGSREPAPANKLQDLHELLAGRNASGTKMLPSLGQVKEAVESRFKELSESGTAVDSISFTGNGEPTIHPQFPQIIEFVLAVRDKYFPNAVTSVFTNGTSVGKVEVAEALAKVDNPIIKLDAGTPDLVARINRPAHDFTPDMAVRLFSSLKFKFIMQTMFVQGDVADNTAPEALEAWYSAVKTISPGKIMIYSIDRDTAVRGLGKVTADRLADIAAPLIQSGFDVQINA